MEVNMSEKFKYAVGLWCLGGCADRFLTSGYLDHSYNMKELINIAGNIKGVKGIEIISSQLEGIDINEYSEWLNDKGLQTTGILANTFGDRKFKLGSITHTNKKIRFEAIDICLKTIEIAEKLNCPMITLWLGSDGFDYPFQSNYISQIDILIESIEKIASFNPNMKICLEYKLKEPRNYLYIGNAPKALYVASQCGENVGVTLDFGHALMSKEKPGESVALLNRNGRLFNVHLNDAYGEWDDDLIVGSVHIPDTLEFLYYLDLIKYNGWLCLDIFPYREDASQAANICIKNLDHLTALLQQVDYRDIIKAQETLDAGISQEIVRKIIFKT